MGKIFVSFVIGFLVIGSLLVYQATSGTSSVILSPQELSQRGSAVTLNRIRVAGKVSEPIVYRTEPSMELTFLVSDPEHPNARVPVVYRNLKPDMFAEGRDVLIDGDYEQGTLAAAKLLTQCPSKYEPPLPGAEVSRSEKSK
jgi:cytochrome c-type biogenesis protein CcmE